MRSNSFDECGACSVFQLRFKVNSSWLSTAWRMRYRSLTNALSLQSRETKVDEKHRKGVCRKECAKKDKPNQRKSGVSDGLTALGKNGEVRMKMDIPTYSKRALACGSPRD